MTPVSQKNADTTRTQQDRTRVSDELTRSAELPAKGNKNLYDSTLPGFGLRVTAKGAKSFVLNYRINGRERRITIGQYGLANRLFCL